MTATLIRTRVKSGPYRVSAALKDPEVQLMLRVRRDDDAAFRELADRYWSQLFANFYRRLGDRQLSEDLAQEALLRIYRYRHRYRPRARFSTWLFHISQNLLRNALRDRRRHPCIRLEASASGGHASINLEPPGRDVLPGPDRRLELFELTKIVRTAVSGLGTRQREALSLFQFQDRSYAEIASAMTMSVKATKSLLYRARLQLRAKLSPYMNG